MVWDDTMLGAADVYAQNNQACIITPFILSGAMSPVTVAGTLTQVLAEVLAGVSFLQLVRARRPGDLRHLRRRPCRCSPARRPSARRRRRSPSTAPASSRAA